MNEEIKEEKQEEENEIIPVENQQPDDDLTDLISELKDEYEKRLNQQREEYEKRLKEREKVIKGLLKGDDKPATKSIAEQINESRKNLFKKW